MATSNSEIANLAISHLGSAKEIGILDTENSQEANACRRFYVPALKATLKRTPWPFAMVTADLTEVEAAPNYEWAYSYRYPSDCLQIHRIHSGIKTDNRQSRTPYQIGKDDDGILIFTNANEAIASYTQYVENPTFYPADFVLAFSYRLASLIASRITGGDPFKLGERTYQAWLLETSSAAATAFNEEQPEELPLSEFSRARNE